MWKSTIGYFRIVAIAEGISYLLLGVTMPLKYVYQIPQPNYVVGLMHGLLFVLYVLLLMRVAWLYRWQFSHIVLAFIASLLPLGTFVADHYIFKPQALRLQQQSESAS
jgi:integral membrane protein